MTKLIIKFILRVMLMDFKKVSTIKMGLVRFLRTITVNPRALKLPQAVCRFYKTRKMITLTHSNFYLFCFVSFSLSISELFFSLLKNLCRPESHCALKVSTSHLVKMRRSHQNYYLNPKPNPILIGFTTLIVVHNPNPK